MMNLASLEDREWQVGHILEVQNQTCHTLWNGQLTPVFVVESSRASCAAGSVEK